MDWHAATLPRQEDARGGSRARAAPGTQHPGRGTRACQGGQEATTCELNDPVSRELVGQGRHTKKRATCTAARKCAPRKRALATGPGTHVRASCVCVAAALNAARSALPDLSDGVEAGLTDCDLLQERGGIFEWACGAMRP